MKWLRPWANRESDHTGEGAKAHADAVENLVEQSERWPEVNRVASSLRELRERNHFADQIALTLEMHRI